MPSIYNFILYFHPFKYFFIQNRSQFDLMAQMKAIRSEKDPNELPYYQKYADCVTAIHKEIISLFIMAHNDKSIRTDVDASLLGFSSTFILQGFYYMLNFMGDSFTEHFSLSKEQFTKFTIKLLLQLLDKLNK